MKNIKTFSVYTLGCKVNIYDSNVIRTTLLSYGLVEVDFQAKPDIYIINTCSVTNNADAKSRHIINKARRINNNALIVVCGCYSQVNHKIENADIILGNKYKNEIYEIIENHLNNNNNNNQFIKVENLLLEKEFENTNVIDYDHTRAFLKIQEGCNFMCSYCIIPFTRGKQRSKEASLIIKDIEQLIANGYKEIVLTGVNTAGYLDRNGVDFYGLLQMINNIPHDFRIRISSVEPFQISDEIINLISNNQKFAQHWHICLQSGDDEVLLKMNRKYSTNQFRTLVDKIYRLNPYSSITTDYIVGFPTETDKQFQNSLAFCKEMKFFNMHIFPYSERKYTRAASLEQVKPEIKSKRMELALDLNKQLIKEHLKKYLNKIVKVLIEEKISEDTYIGKSSEYFNVIVHSKHNIINKMLDVKINKIILDKCFGELINYN